MLPCPCQSAESYDNCCARYHRGEARAPSAERLMRSRYSAYALGDAAYLLASWHPSTRPAMCEPDPAVRWYRLEIMATTGGGIFDSSATVEFCAYYRHADGGDVQHENSRFIKEDGAWLYVNAVSS
ncbi:MAG: YchJ family protein [Rhodoglobus sp.]